MDMTEKTLESQTLFDGKIVHLRRDIVEVPGGGHAIREVVDHPGGVGIVPVDADGCVFLVRQFRYPYGKAVLEVPAGKLEWGEEHFSAAQRELEEEIGARAERWTPMGEMLPTPGFCDELQHVYLARGLTFGETHPDEDEFLEIEKLPFAEAVEMAVDGRLEDSKTVAAILRAWHWMERERNG